MKKQTVLKAIAIISFLGILFSGYLSYAEIFQQTASLCASGTCGQQLAGIPVCIYGLIMYLTVFIISVIGLKSKN